MRDKAIIKAGIAGGAGYTGGEMLRILLNHPGVEIAFVHSRSNAGELVSKAHGDLVGDTDIRFCSEISNNADVIFLCLGHEESKKFLTENKLAGTLRIIDLSQDFRLEKDSVFDARTFVYGLPEVNKQAITQAENVANPGCFATAIQLGILPLAAIGSLNEVHTTGITGATGAGQKLSASSHFAWRANNIQAYKSLTHQHIHEIMQTVGRLQPRHRAVNFIPWRGDFTRGIYVTSYTRSELSIQEAYTLYNSFYAEAPFTFVSHDMIDLKQVINTNKCLLHLEKEGDRLIIHSAIDNLIKGASGQAVQNMNLMFGLAEDAGLRLKATSF